jgi:hypothetical protein
LTLLLNHVLPNTQTFLHVCVKLFFIVISSFFTQFSVNAEKLMNTRAYTRARTYTHTNTHTHTHVCARTHTHTHTQAHTHACMHTHSLTHTHRHTHTLTHTDTHTHTLTHTHNTCKKINLRFTLTANILLLFLSAKARNGCSFPALINRLTSPHPDH